MLLSGTIGDHGITILSQREGLEFESAIHSDTAALHALGSGYASGELLRSAVCGIRRAAGCRVRSTKLQSGRSVSIELQESAIPIRDEVQGACEMLGLDPLYVANEGKLLAIVEPAAAEPILEAMRQHPLGRDARIIGTVTDSHRGMVTLRTRLGTSRIVDLLSGDQLPRIC